MGLVDFSMHIGLQDSNALICDIEHLKFHISLQSPDDNRPSGLGDLAGDAGGEGAVLQLCILMGCLGLSNAHLPVPFVCIKPPHQVLWLLQCHFQLQLLTGMTLARQVWSVVVQVA